MNRKNLSSEAPLAGVKIIDISAYIAAPSACVLLADMGAQIIKIEPPSGDALRHYPSTLAGEQRAFIGVNRSKRGMVIDLKKQAGREILFRLLADTDVLVHNFRPGVPARLGIDYPDLCTVKPDLIYCGITGYGESGPLARRAGYDQVLQSITGICNFQGLGKRHPEIVYGSVVDFYAGAMLAGAICGALYQRERTGKGQSLGVSLLGAALAMQMTRMVWADGEPRDIGRDMRSGGVTGIHPCAENSYLYLSANTPHFWTALCAHLGEPALSANPDYATTRQRAQRAAEIVPVIQKALLKRPALEWEDIFGEDVPCAAVRGMEDMFDHPQVLHQQLVSHMSHAAVGGYRSFAGAFRFDGMPGGKPFAAPSLGQHTEDILKECGYASADIEQLRQNEVI